MNGSTNNLPTSTAQNMQLFSFNVSSSTCLHTSVTNSTANGTCSICNTTGTITTSTCTVCSAVTSRSYNFSCGWEGESSCTHSGMEYDKEMNVTCDVCGGSGINTWDSCPHCNTVFNDVYTYDCGWDRSTNSSCSNYQSACSHSSTTTTRSNERTCSRCGQTNYDWVKTCNSCNATVDSGSVNCGYPNCTCTHSTTTTNRNTNLMCPICSNLTGTQTTVTCNACNITVSSSMSYSCGYNGSDATTCSGYTCPHTNKTVVNVDIGSEQCPKCREWAKKYQYQCNSCDEYVGSTWEEFPCGYSGDGDYDSCTGTCEHRDTWKSSSSAPNDCPKCGSSGSFVVNKCLYCNKTMSEVYEYACGYDGGSDWDKCTGQCQHYNTYDEDVDTFDCERC